MTTSLFWQGSINIVMCGRFKMVHHHRFKLTQVKNITAVCKFGLYSLQFFNHISMALFILIFIWLSINSIQFICK